VVASSTLDLRSDHHVARDAIASGDDEKTRSMLPHGPERCS